MSTRAKKAKLMAEIRQYSSKNALDALVELLALELAGAQEELEQAADDRTIWRAQGRAATVRSVLAAINPRTAA